MYSVKRIYLGHSMKWNAHTGCAEWPGRCWINGTRSPLATVKVHETQAYLQALHLTKQAPCSQSVTWRTSSTIDIACRRTHARTIAYRLTNHGTRGTWCPLVFFESGEERSECCLIKFSPFLQRVNEFYRWFFLGFTRIKTAKVRHRSAKCE